MKKYLYPMDRIKDEYRALIEKIKLIDPIIAKDIPVTINKIIIDYIKNFRLDLERPTLRLDLGNSYDIKMLNEVLEEAVDLCEDLKTHLRASKSPYEETMNFISYVLRVSGSDYKEFEKALKENPNVKKTPKREIN